jgi:hypothetical protein
LIFHQLPPSFHRSAAAPTPAFSKTVDWNALLVGASASDYSRSSYFRGYFQRALIGPTAMATKQWDHVVPFGIKHQHRRVDALSLYQGGN